MGKTLNIFSFGVNRDAGNPVVKFTPAFFKTTYEYFRRGVWTWIIEMMNQSEIDSYVAGCVKGRRAGFKREWTVKPFSEEARDVERADWIRQILNGLSWRDLFEDIQEALLKIYKVIDFEWDARDGRQIIVSHEGLDHKYFRVDPADMILKIDMGKTLEDIPDTALVCRSKKTPEMLPVVRDFILKNFGIDAWAAFLETFGEPFLLGKYPPGSDKTVKDELQAALDAIARSSRGQMPDNANIEIKETSRTTGDYKEFTGICNTGIAISLLGHANAVEQSSGMQVGENLSSFKARREIAEDDMYWIEQNVGKIIRMLVDRNFADGRYPSIEISKKDQPDHASMRDAIDLAFRCGVELPATNFKKLGLDLSEDQPPVKKEPSVLSY